MVGLAPHCRKRGRVSWPDKRAIERDFGNHYLMHLSRKLQCACGNEEGNAVLIGTLPR
jgi:hypothetical protein